MKIGGEYDPEKVGPRQIEKLANEAALSVPMVRYRLVELANAVIAALPTATPEGAFASSLAAQIAACCRRMLRRFQK